MSLSHFLCLVMGGAVVGVIMFPRGAEPEPAARAPIVLLPDPRPDEIAARLDQLAPQLARIDDLAARLERAEHAVEEVRSNQPEVALLEPPPGVPTKQRMTALALTRDPERVSEALKAWQAIEETSADPKRRAEACFEQGQIYIKLAEATKSPDDWRVAADAFRKVVDQIGLGTTRGQTAGYQLGLCECRAGDKRAGYDALRRLCEAPHLVTSAAPTYRYSMACLALAIGDIDTARRELGRYIADYESDRADHVRGFVKSAREKLAQLK